MIPGSMIYMRVMDEQGNNITARDLCIPSNAQVRPACGEYIRTSDGKKRYLVVSGEWCKLYDDKDREGFKLTLRDVSDTLTDEEKNKEK